MNMKHSIEEAIEHCDRAAKGLDQQNAFAALAQVLRAGWAVPDQERLNQLADELAASGRKCVELSSKYQTAEECARKLWSEATDARAVLAKVLDRSMADVKLSDVNDLVLEIAAESERTEAAETARDNAMLRSYALENALRMCLDACEEPVEDLPQHAQQVLAQRVRKIVTDILVRTTKNEQTRGT
jgi:hypothetical protein